MAPLKHPTADPPVTEAQEGTVDKRLYETGEESGCHPCPFHDSRGGEIRDHPIQAPPRNGVEQGKAKCVNSTGNELPDSFFPHHPIPLFLTPCLSRMGGGRLSPTILATTGSNPCGVDPEFAGVPPFVSGRRSEILTEGPVFACGDRITGEGVWHGACHAGECATSKLQARHCMRSRLQGIHLKVYPLHAFEDLPAGVHDLCAA